MYLAVEKYDTLKVFTLQNILCFNGNILKLKGIRFMGITFKNFFFPSVLFLLTLTTSKKKRGETYCSG